MAQMTVRQIDEQRYEQLRTRARMRGVSAELLAREAIHDAAQLTVDEKRALVREMQAKGEQAKVPGVEQTPGWVLIREDRDLDH
jgi:plasmid stability protein